MIPFVYSPPCDGAGPVPGGAHACCSGAGQRSTEPGGAILADGESAFSFLAWIDRSMAQVLAQEPGRDGPVGMHASPAKADGRSAGDPQDPSAAAQTASVHDGVRPFLSQGTSSLIDAQAPTLFNPTDPEGSQGRPAPLTPTLPAPAARQPAGPAAAADPTGLSQDGNGPSAADQGQPETVASGRPPRNAPAPATGYHGAPGPAVHADRSATQTGVVSDHHHTATAATVDGVPAPGTTARPSGNPQPQPQQAEPSSTVQPSPRQTAAFADGPTGPTHGLPTDGAVPSHVDGHLSGAVMGESLHPQQHLRRPSGRADRFGGQRGGVDAAAVNRADSETMSTPADPAIVSAKRHFPSELPYEALDRPHGDSGKGSAPTGPGGTAPEPNQPNGLTTEGGKFAALDLLSSAADKPATSPAAGLERSDAPSTRAFQTIVMDQVVGKAAMRTLNGRSEIQIRLKPDFLGSVQMTVAGDKDQMAVRILTDQPMVKEIIETHLHQLKAELHHQGLTIDRFEVMVRPNVDQQANRDSLFHNMNQQSSQHGRRQGREQNPENPHGGSPDHAMEETPGRSGINYFA